MTEEHRRRENELEDRFLELYSTVSPGQTSGGNAEEVNRLRRELNETMQRHMVMMAVNKNRLAKFKSEDLRRARFWNRLETRLHSMVVAISAVASKMVTPSPLGPVAMSRLRRRRH